MRRLLVLLALAACAPGLSPAATQGLAAALQRRGLALLADDPAAPSTDLAGLRALVGGARVVGLGQSGAGTRELPRVVHRVLRYLVEETGFTGLALDADASAGLALDAYAQGGAVDIDAALLALGDRGLATVELRELLTWVRTHNAAGRGAPVRVFGVDPRDPEAAAAVVLTYLGRVDPSYVPEARSLLAGGQQLAVESVLARLDALRAALPADEAAAWSVARQQAEVVAQARRMAETWEFEAGEFARARNIEWALAQLGPRGKLLVWASNRRIAAEVPGAAPSMGNFLRQWLGADYRPIAVSFAGGELLAPADPDLLCPAPIAPPRPGSLDAALAGPGMPRALLDLRGLAEPGLRAPQVLRSLDGARAEDTRLRPALAFDAVLGLQRVSPARPLGATPAARAGCVRVPAN